MHIMSLPQPVSLQGYKDSGLQSPGGQVLLANNVAVHACGMFSSANSGHIKLKVAYCDPVNISSSNFSLLNVYVA